MLDLLALAGHDHHELVPSREVTAAQLVHCRAQAPGALAVEISHVHDTHLPVIAGLAATLAVTVAA